MDVNLSIDAVQAIDLFLHLLLPWLIIVTIGEQGEAQYYMRQEGPRLATAIKEK
jgi:hypothetical protein